MRHITQEDIARMLGVTRITVSKALRGHPDISAAMKQRVAEAVAQSGYSPNQIARQLVSRATRTIGVIVPDLENSFYSFVVNSIIDEAAGRGYQALLTVSRENPVIEKNNLSNLLGMRVDGLLVCLSQKSNDSSVFDPVSRMELPLVYFDRIPANGPHHAVVFDDYRAVRQAIDQLVIAGFTRIAHFSGYNTTNVGRERLAGYRDGLDRNGLIIWKEWVIEGGYEMIDGYDAFRRLHKSGNLPEVVLTVNDRVALGVYRACRELGLRIPEDIGVAGFGFPETTRMFNPPLAVVSQDPRLMGQTAARHLIDMIQYGTKEPSGEIRLPADFQWNDSIKLKR
jgi:DNA-binding LacI/PurR family transcriptional regulator